MPRSISETKRVLCALLLTGSNGNNCVAAVGWAAAGDFHSRSLLIKKLNPRQTACGGCALKIMQLLALFTQHSSSFAGHV